MKKNVFKIDGFIYVTSDEKPKLNEYGVGYAHGIRGKYAEHYLFLNDGSKLGKLNALCADALTVIATNNNNLPIQQLTNEEVAYCEGNDYMYFEEDPIGCNLQNCDGNPCLNYKLLIPKEQETIEPKLVAYDKQSKLIDKTLEIANKRIIELQSKEIDQLKREKELMFSNNEVIKVIQECKNYLSFGDEFDELKWFEQFKK